MTSNSKTKQDLSPVIKITILNPKQDIKDLYSKQFMTPLIDGLLKRMQFAEANKYKDVLL